MCVLSIPALLTAVGGGGAATAAGATAAAATAGAATAATTLQTVGTIASIGGSLLSGVMGYQQGQYQKALVEQQRQTAAQIASVEEQRTRDVYESQMRTQFAELASRGVDLSSPTVALLGRAAAKELSFAAQSVRSGAQAQDIELSAASQSLQASSTLSVLQGGTTAAGIFLEQAPEVWPELLA